jgi:hypothetical protein
MPRPIVRICSNPIFPMNICLHVTSISPLTVLDIASETVVALERGQTAIRNLLGVTRSKESCADANSQFYGATVMQLTGERQTNRRAAERSADDGQEEIVECLDVVSRGMGRLDGLRAIWWSLACADQEASGSAQGRVTAPNELWSCKLCGIYFVTPFCVILCM